MVKRRDLEKRLQDNGWHFLRHGGSHDLWTNNHQITEIPRHREISERLYQEAFVKKLHLK